MSVSLDGKVAVVTGAAHGLGREHALALARQGARVVVNDLGATADGSGRDESAAQIVVDEIKSAGGEAVAHFGDVADWNDARAMVGRAVETFGDLHILVNNAGFTRDATIFNMTEDEFDSVVRVHLKGHFCPTKFAMQHWREASKRAGAPIFGRLIATSSEAFIFGSVGQPNYAAAKAGIVAMTMGCAQRGLKYGVTANVVMPRARTRMTLQGPTAAIFQQPEEGFDHFAPEHVSPLYAYLASPAAERVSGQVFVVWGKQLTVLGRPTTETRFESTEAWTPEGFDARLGPHFAGLTPVTDGFLVPPA